MVTITNPVVTTSVINGSLYAVFSATVTENKYQYVGGMISWGDGTTTSLSRQLSPASIGGTHVYRGVGDFSFLFVAQNYAVPTANTAEYETQLSYYNNPANLPPVPITLANYTYIGPILPRTNGEPTLQDWDWDLGTDTLAVEASLKLLMYTNKGEYLMDSNYGANLRTLVFSPNDPVLLDVIKADVLSALTNYEPRAQLSDINFSQNNTVATVNATFASRLAPGAVPLQLSFSV